MKYMKPLTPAFRRQIEDGIDRQLMELSECNNTVYVSALRKGLTAYKNLINVIPDGYPILVEDKG